MNQHRSTGRRSDTNHYLPPELTPPNTQTLIAPGTPAYTSHRSTPTTTTSQLNRHTLLNPSTYVTHQTQTLYP
ncbi:hypothetical protein E2C01_043099 [Portunus trituberculatus]|uniref:Uncharacterized protein n=1 Tax=Portunus trituberculatus TaxID=210409 RepID=A0A5B7FPC2_PORTR|nr:hypothetical protein [Portunus trituberculatus]